MSKQPAGKTLLRNVIRHTDAHNKIQEEMEMWKMRGWEVQKSRRHQLPFTDKVRGHMHCDRMLDHQEDQSERDRERTSQHYSKEARYWTRKLYEFEASDPDRWGHSGFKELYPEEFESDSEKDDTVGKSRQQRKKKSKTDAKKSPRKKKKKKKKKAENKRSRKENAWSSGEKSETRDKQRKRKRTKSRHKNKKNGKTRERGDSSSEDSAEEKSKQGSKKRKQVSRENSESDSEPDVKRKRRKEWKAPSDDSSRDMCED